MKRFLPLAALALLVVPAGRSAPPPPQFVCNPMPPELIGSYYRYDDRSWSLTFTTDCAYRAVHNSTEEGGGNYTVTEQGVDTLTGTFVFSDDRGCQSAGILGDEPTPYDYSYQHGLLTLAAAGTDLCYNPKEPAAGRAGELGGHGGWIRAVAGNLRLALKGSKRGSFTSGGVIADKGSFTVTRSRVKKGVKIRTLRFKGEQGSFAIVEHVKKTKATWSLVGIGSGGYRNLTGNGKGAATKTRQALHGNVSN